MASSQLAHKLLAVTGRVPAQAKKFSAEIGQGIKRANAIRQQAALQTLQRELDIMLARVGQVIRQAKARVFEGNTHGEGKLVSLFEPDTEIIRKGKASKPTEFGKLVKVQEAENQIITAYQVYEQRPSDCDLLVPAVAMHEQRLERVPELDAGDAGFYSAGGETQAHEMGVKRISIPNHSTKSAEAPASSETALVPQRAEVENRLRRKNQRTRVQLGFEMLEDAAVVVCTVANYLQNADKSLTEL
jgi:transposase, IS5 family